MKSLISKAFLLIMFLSYCRAQVQHCVGRPWTAICLDNPNWGTRGPGCRPRVMWWYDRNLRSCRQMWYGGCGGNQNRWCSREACERFCRR